jgi:N-methylhydantoinase A/oxoprolinase/acetone carboxylase beta subunit
VNAGTISTRAESDERSVVDEGRTLADAERKPDSIDEPDYYQLLGVSYSATHAEITRAYRTAIKRIHPDRQSPAKRALAEEQSKQLNRAFTTLSKPDLRRHYDQRIRGQIVQDQIMSRYVGGFGVPGASPSDYRMRRQQTPAERRDRERADRGALVSIAIIFGGIALTVVALLVIWSIAGAVWNAVF